LGCAGLWITRLRLTSVNDTTGSGSRTTSHLYDSASRRSRMTYSGGFYITYSFNTDGSLTSIKENGPSTGSGLALAT